MIANTISSVQGITGQILTNAQGQVPPGRDLPLQIHRPHRLPLPPPGLFLLGKEETDAAGGGVCPPPRGRAFAGATPAPSPGSPPFAQVIGTLPWVVNPPGMAAASPAPAALPAQNLQVQTVTPQLLLNAQGQVIATLAGSAIQAAAIKKTGTPEPPSKNEVSDGHGADSRVAKGLAASPAAWLWEHTSIFGTWPCGFGTQTHCFRRM